MFSRERDSLKTLIQGVSCSRLMSTSVYQGPTGASCVTVCVCVCACESLCVCVTEVWVNSEG